MISANAAAIKILDNYNKVKITKTPTHRNVYAEYSLEDERIKD